MPSCLPYTVRVLATTSHLPSVLCRHLLIPATPGFACVDLQPLLALFVSISSHSWLRLCRSPATSGFVCVDLQPLLASLFSISGLLASIIRALIGIHEVFILAALSPFTLDVHVSVSSAASVGQRNLGAVHIRSHSMAGRPAAMICGEALKISSPTNKTSRTEDMLYRLEPFDSLTVEARFGFLSSVTVEASPDLRDQASTQERYGKAMGHSKGQLCFPGAKP